MTETIRDWHESAGNITGMGIRYGNHGLNGSRLFDFTVRKEAEETRIYSLLDYRKFTLLIFGENMLDTSTPPFINVIQIFPEKHHEDYWTDNCEYTNQIVLVRPDSYIALVSSLEEINSLSELNWESLL